ncbi:VOC family protein [Prosthecomicrobium pneumaticum]|uniref:Catechol 2,3-dioxygenase-like lactoylglutathione lyase family enzyme n=1 Tax=Prosthecomicrobium pneumaticum TaxID=81895 RepID=A0A7W9L3K2_9HYPH|nr:VOC family protein [Prosthecomicrobium pneumaticum]MBB5754641.1 catechol 2,3-dioxygenase-like lactoylglutathione lyase family enzyme [Prosthecomicrobium pneumaticum]
MAAAPAIDGILETALYVEDLARARAFYETVMGLAPMMADDRFVAYRAGGASVLLLFRRGGTRADVETPGGTIPAHDGSGPAHFAFAIPADALDPWRRRFAEAGVPIRSEVSWPRGGTSLYVDDPDGHVVELATPGLWPEPAVT